MNLSKENTTKKIYFHLPINWVEILEEHYRVLGREIYDRLDVIARHYDKGILTEGFYMVLDAELTKIDYENERE